MAEGEPESGGSFDSAAFLERVRERRAALGGLSEREVCKRADVNTGYFKDIRKAVKGAPGGTKVPGSEIGTRIARVLGVHLRWLLWGTGPELLDGIDEFDEMRGLMEDMTPDGRKMAIELVRGVRLRDKEKMRQEAAESDAVDDRETG